MIENLNVSHEKLNAAIKQASDEADMQTTSLRLPTNLIIRLDELIGTHEDFGVLINRTRVLTKSIEDCIDALEINANLLIKKVKAVEEEIKGREPKAFLLNTNIKNDMAASEKMLMNGEASAFYSGWKEQIEYLQKGDKVFLYQSGAGIRGYGVVEDGELIKRDFNDDKDAEYTKKLQDFVLLKKPITPKVMKSSTKSGFNFRMTLAEIKGKEVIQILSNLAAE